MERESAVNPTSVRLPSELVAAVDRTARKDLRTRQAQIEMLLREALRARGEEA